MRGLRWRDVGLLLPAAWPRLAAIGIAWGFGMWLLEFFVTMPALRRVLNWILAAFGGKTVWRGYALPRAANSR